jgi:cytochrome c peroxidase
MPAYPTPARFARVATAALLALACAGALAQQYAQQIAPLPPAPTLDPQRIALGERLFRDARLARDNSVACISCHSFEHGGADARARSTGVGGAQGPLNAPSIFNSAHNFRQLWSGAAGSLEEQIDRVIRNPAVFNSSWPEILAKLRQDTALERDFRLAYPLGLNEKTAADAIASYERSLVTPSRFDSYLQGKSNAITAAEKKGFDNFRKYGCVACHQGVNVGGNMYQKFGALRDYFADRKAAGKPVTEADRGRFNVTGRPEDMYVFKVPSLRNVAQTAPYFHDGSAATLEEAVEVMFKYQLGREATAGDTASIIGFLRTLSGKPEARP